MIRSLINNIITGLGIGFIAVTITLYFMLGNDSTMAQFIGWFFASIFYGAVSIIFQFEKINYKLLSLIHCFLCFTITITTGYFLGYADSFVALVKDMGFLFLIIYAVIYIFSYSYCACSAKKINEKLKHSH